MRTDSSPKRSIFLGLVFASGFAGLVYQVLWLRQLGLLFGNTAYAASTTLTVFFLGLSAGNWAWSRWSSWRCGSTAGSRGVFFCRSA